jgi:hypothetical protein
MPAHNEKQLDDQRIADFYAFRHPAESGATRGTRL